MIRTRVALAVILLASSWSVAQAQSLLNSFTTIALQRCLAAIEAGSPPRARTLFPGEPKAGLLPETMFSPIGHWLTPDDRIYLSIDARGNCAVGDTRASDDAQAHEGAIRRFDAWASKETSEGRYVDTNLAEESFAYRKTFVSTGWSEAPILVTLVSDQAAGLLALVVEKSDIITDDPGEIPSSEDGEGSSLEESPQTGSELNLDNSL